MREQQTYNMDNPDSADNAAIIADVGVKVAVRVRPYSQREKDMDDTCSMPVVGPGALRIAEEEEDGSRQSRKLDKRAQAKLQFTFDYCFWSVATPDASGSTNHIHSQDEVYTAMGKRVIVNAFAGFNSSIFAYGQTGAGKSWTMMGGAWSDTNGGLIPRLCKDLLDAADLGGGCVKHDDVETTQNLKCSYFEIYMEKVGDLLNKSSGKMRVREDKKTGVYVEGLTEVNVTEFSNIEDTLNQGNASRTVASTKMNAESSRSHAIFLMIFTQTSVNKAAMTATDRVSKINLVDLAGSEEVKTTEADGQTLKEAAKINLSLTQLGRVIMSLSSDKKKGEKPPYRDSVLTWLLRESLGGNAKTSIIAALSPGLSSRAETFRTLKYASRAKKIENKVGHTLFLQQEKHLICT